MPGSPHTPSTGDVLRAAGAHKQDLPSSSQTARFTPGTVLQERYRIVGLLGRGGMGEVYRADDLTLGQTVALKFLNEALAHDTRLREQMLAEVRLAREVSHPSVCRVFDVGQVDEHMFISMEYVDGEDLGDLLLRVGRLPAEKALEIARQLCAGLATVHERGLVHRDLKPANVMLDGRGKVRLTDFGLASALGEVEGQQGIVGTPAYMAPELFDGQAPSVQSDLYALGLVLYEVVTGRRAFEADDLMGLMEAHREQTVKPPSSVLSDVDPRVEQVIDRCLAKDPQQRPDSALAVSAALPGGDPVAEALARGHTPSPGAVAASGGSGALQPRALLAWLALAAAGFLALCWATPQARLSGSIPLELPPDVFEHKAREMLDGALRYTERYQDWDWGEVHKVRGFRRDYKYSQWLLAAERSGGQVKPPEYGTPPYSFWYRASRSRIVSPAPNQHVSFSNPPRGRRPEAALNLNPAGELNFYEAYWTNWTPHGEDSSFEGDVWTPPEPSMPSAAEQADLLRLAGLDPELMRPVRPSYWPRVPLDVRLAWLGPAPGSSGGTGEPLEVRVEAGYLHGRPAAFAVQDEEPPPEALELRESSFGRMVRAARDFLDDYLMMAVLLAGLVIMIQNFRARRGDRQGALRLAAFVTTTMMVRWLINTHYVGSPRGQFQYVGQALGLCMYTGALAWMLYLGLEPLMRRFWPRLLVGWTRALEGRFRDPMVARDLLIGLAMGLLMAAITPLASVVALGMGAPPPRPFDADIGSLASGWAALDTLLRVLPNAPLTALIGALLFTLARLIFRRQWIALLALFPIAILSIPMQGTFGSVPIDLVVNSIACTVWAVTLLRYGVLAASVMQGLYMLVEEAPLTLDLSAWHALPSVLLLCLAVAIGLFAARHALQPRAGV